MVRARQHLRHPVGQEHIEFTGRFGESIGYPDKPLPVGGEHRKAVEMAVERESLQALPVVTDQKEMETRSPALSSGLDVGGKDDPLAVGMKEGGEI